MSTQSVVSQNPENSGWPPQVQSAFGENEGCKKIPYDDALLGAQLSRLAYEPLTSFIFLFNELKKEKKMDAKNFNDMVTEQKKNEKRQLNKGIEKENLYHTINGIKNVQNSANNTIFYVTTSADLNCYVCCIDNKIFVCFRGTNSLHNILTDMKFVTQNICKEKKNRAFKGVVQLLLPILNVIFLIIEKIIDNKSDITNIFFVGHSLGGALAIIMGYYYCKKIDKHVTILSYGSPKILNKQLKEDFNQLLVDEKITFVRFITKGDPITNIPPTLQHPGGPDNVCRCHNETTKKITGQNKGYTIDYNKPIKCAVQGVAVPNPLKHGVYLKIGFFGVLDKFSVKKAGNKIVKIYKYNNGQITSKYFKFENVQETVNLDSLGTNSNKSWKNYSANIKNVQRTSPDLEPVYDTFCENSQPKAESELLPFNLSSCTIL